MDLVMTNTIEVIWTSDDLIIAAIFSVDDGNLFTEDLKDNHEFIKQASIWYLRNHYKIDPEILGLSYNTWNFVDDGTQEY